MKAQDGNGRDKMGESSVEKSEDGCGDRNKLGSLILVSPFDFGYLCAIFVQGSQPNGESPQSS